MYLKYFLSLALCLSIFLACNTSKKSLATAPKSEFPKTEQRKIDESQVVASDSQRTATPNVLSGLSIISPPLLQADSVYLIPSEVVAFPGEEQLGALQSKYQGITLETLRLGHEIFNSTCTGCHGQKSIYERSEARWHIIIEDMAQMAELNAIEKDAVMNYVLSVKATQFR